MDDQHYAEALSCSRQVPLGVDGQPLIRTPHLDRLASQGVRFAACYTPTAICGPSRTSLFTGTNPHTHRHFGNDTAVTVDPDLPSLVSILKSAGYVTGLFGKDHLPGCISVAFDERQEKPEYFDHLAQLGINRDPEEEDPIVRERFFSFSSRIPKAHCREVWTAERAMDFMTRHRGDPWFAWVSFERPHSPHSPDLETEQLVDPARVVVDSATCELFEKVKIQGRPLCENFWNVLNYDEETFRRAVARYYALIVLIDEQIGRILAHLDALDLTGRTLILFAPDHGDFGGRYGQIGKNLPAYEELVKVPLIWKDPAAPQRRGQVVQGLWSTIDILPSVLERLGLRVPTRCEGRSFLGALRGVDGTDRPYVIAETVFTRSIRTKDYKLVVNPRRPFNGHLFRMLPEPDELTNLWHCPAHRDVRERLLILLLMEYISSTVPLDFDPNWEPSPECGSPTPSV